MLRSAPMRAIALLIGIALSVPPRAHAQSTVLLAADQGTHLEVVAHFSGSTWTTAPTSGPGRSVPRDWTRWYALGESAPIRLSSTAPAGRCAAPRKLPILSPPSRRIRSEYSPYVGIAVSGSIPIEPMTLVTDASAQWMRITSAVAPLFERRAAEHGVSASTFDKVPLRIDWVYAVGSGSGRAYYFEASKRVPDAGNTPAEDPKGIVRVAVSGWLRSMGEQLVPAGTKSALHWEPADERPGSRRPSLLPLGVLRQGDERIWVMNGQTGVRETFTLYAAGTSAVRTLLTVDASAC
jgi:hypothetical protein